MKELIEAIFGEYVPITYELTSVVSVPNQQLVDGTVVNYETSSTVVNTIIPEGMAGVDWTYVLGVLGFFIVLYCILRIIGGVISRV